MEWLIVAVVVWIACGLAAAAIRRNRPDGENWFVIGFLLGPLGLLMAAMPGHPDDADRPICVHCGKPVARGRERLCNHCGQKFAA